MQELAARLNQDALKFELTDFAYEDEYRQELANDLLAAADLIRQMAEQQPVAWMWQHDETGRTGFIDQWQVNNGWQEQNPRCKIVGPLYAAPPAPHDDTALLQRALDALTESVDTIQREYDTDWRHGIPTREKQLAGMKAIVDEHVATIDALRARLDGAPQPARELPPLPLTKSQYGFDHTPAFTADQMRDYARATLAAYGIRSEE
jgi:hypothetical protein